MSFTQIKQFIIKNKKALLFVSFFALLVFPNYVFAEGDNSSVVDIVNMILKFSAVVLGLVTNFVAWFMSPSWTNGTAVGISSHLKDLWIMMSNVVYFIFAFILIWIALMNIIGKGGDWELKQALPRFIGGVLIVPFSWLIVGAMISLSSILSVSVLTLPQDSFPDAYEKNLGNVEFCEEYDFYVGADQKGKSGVNCKDGKTIDFNTYLQNPKNIFGIINVYTYGIMKLDDQGKLNSNAVTKGEISSIVDLGIKGIMDLIFIVVYLILMIALLMALFVRGVYIWVFMVISPLFGLMFFFKDKGGETFKKFSLSNFVGLALMPVYVSAALSFGLLFMLVAGSQMNDNCKDKKDTEFCSKYENDISSVEFLGVKLNFIGAFSSAGDNKKVLSELQGSFGLMIMQIFGLAVLRIAVMAALGSTDITKEVVAPIKSFGDSVGKLAAAAPTYAPIIPSPAGGTMSAAGMGRLGQSINTHYSNKALESGDKAATAFFGGGDIPVELKSEMRKLGDKLKSGNKNDIKNYREKVFTKLKDLKTARTDHESQKYLKVLAEKASMKITGKEFSDQTSFAKFLYNLNNNLVKNFGTGILSGSNITDTNPDQLEKYFSGTPSTSSSSGSSGSTSSGKKYSEYEGGKIKTLTNINGKIEVVNEKDRDFKIILNNDGKGEEYNFNFNGKTNETAKSFSGNELKQAKELYNIINDDDGFKEIIGKLGYKNTDDLLKSVKK